MLAVVTWRARPHPGLHGMSLVIAVAACCFVATFPAVLRVKSPLFGLPAYWVGVRAHVPFLVLLAASSVTLELLQPAGPGFIGLFLAMAVVARVSPPRLSAALFGACLAFFGVLMVVHGSVWLDGRKNAPGFVFLLAVVAVYVMSLLARRIQYQEQQEERLLAELEESRNAELRAAALAERQRLAREMHDVLAHSLSGLVVQLEGARLLAAAAPGDARLPVAIDRAHQLARSGLDEARQAIGMLRDDELPGPDRLAGLAARFETDTGIPCRFTEIGARRELSSAVRLALYRITQEGLTNVRKHACPDQVDVRLEYLPDVLTLAIEDRAAARVAAPGAGGFEAGADGTGGPTVPGGGYGLTGMRERADLLGGSLSAGQTREGFQVLLRVPA
jgi:signal transduction histidine kinase